MEYLKIANTLLDMKAQILHLESAVPSLIEEHLNEVENLNKVRKVINKLLLGALERVEREL